MFIGAHSNHCTVGDCILGDFKIYRCFTIFFMVQAIINQIMPKKIYFKQLYRCGNPNQKRVRSSPWWRPTGGLIPSKFLLYKFGMQIYPIKSGIPHILVKKRLSYVLYFRRQLWFKKHPNYALMAVICDNNLLSIMSSPREFLFSGIDSSLFISYMCF